MSRKFLLITAIIFIALFYIFRNYSTTLPVQEYDEKMWITNSWNLISDNDQPMFLKYVFKSWLSIRYGQGSSLKVDEMVLDARTISQLLLSLNIILVSWFFLKHKGVLFSVVLLFLYTTNYLLVRNGVLAQSESLFVILFNLSLFFIFEYFLKEFKLKNLILFSIFTGLTFSTKLNGIMPYIIFFILYNIEIVKDRIKVTLLTIAKVVVPLLCIFFIFVILNPFVRDNPIPKTLEMFQHRSEIISTQTKLFYESAIPNIGDRYLKIADNLLLKAKFPMISALLFTIGFLKSLKNSLKENQFSNMMIKMFLITVVITGFYYELNWPRYLTHLVLFIIYFQIEGVLDILKILFSRSKKLNAYINLG